MMGQAQKGKVFFSEEKKQKTFDSWSLNKLRVQTNKSLFASFSSEKEDSSLLGRARR